MVKDLIKRVSKTDSQWRNLLSDNVFEVTRNGGTEKPFTGKYNNHFSDGLYACACCGNELFDSKFKFKSSCGWPSYSEPLCQDSVDKNIDLSHNMSRTEVKCSGCDAHLGHVFDDGPEHNGLRYCINSAALIFKKVK